MLRHDRGDESFRKISIETGLIGESLCKGSCRFQHGKSSVISSIYLSTPKYLRFESNDRMTVEVQYINHQSTGRGADLDQEFSNANKRQERFVNSFINNIVVNSIDVSIHPGLLLLVRVVVEYDDGSLLACAVNSVSMALATCGIDMYHVPIALTLVSSSSDTLDREDNSSMSMDSHHGCIYKIDPVHAEEMDTNIETNLLAIFKINCIFSPPAASGDDNLTSNTNEEPVLLASQLLNIDGICDMSHMNSMLSIAASKASELMALIRTAMRR